MAIGRGVGAAPRSDRKGELSFAAAHRTTLTARRSSLRMHPSPLSVARAWHGCCCAASPHEVCCPVSLSRLPISHFLGAMATCVDYTYSPLHLASTTSSYHYTKLPLHLAPTHHRKYLHRGAAVILETRLRPRLIRKGWKGLLGGASSRQW